MTRTGKKSVYTAADAMKPVNFALADHGTVLATRAEGQDVGDQVRRLVVDDASLVLSFNDVRAITPPFFDELFKILRVMFGAESPRKRALVVTGLSDDTRETIEMVLERHKASLVELKGEHLDLISGIPHLAETLVAAQELGKFTAPELAERLDLTVPNINHRLKKLVEAGALTRETDKTAEHGRRYSYQAHAAPDLAAAGR
ncbi:MAG TPA: helix-turn-helix domain-containing protein [Baekduia sp.]|jgi:DNA-binding transcriptional ArsR family regulator|nr:helix-turn-helix domain-containing protein [Baekduia sp.]